MRFSFNLIQSFIILGLKNKFYFVINKIPGCFCASGDFYVNSFGLLLFFKKADYKKTSK